MKPDSSEARALRDAFVRRARDARPGDDCPSPDRIWSGVRGELSGESTEELVEHTAICAACAEAWRLARDFEYGSRELPAQEGDREGLVRGPWYGRARNWALAAAAALLVAVGINLLQRFDNAGRPAFRTVETNPIRSLIPEGQVLARDQAVLRWTPGPEGSQYNIWVANEDLDILTSARGLDEARFRVPPLVLENLPAGARIVWQVEVRTPDGQRFSSETVVTQLE